MKNIFTLILTLLLISTNSISQSSKTTQSKMKGDFLIVRTYEVMKGSAAKSIMSISDGFNELITVDLKLISKKTSGENLEVLVRTLNEIKNQGYVLVQTNSGGGNSAGVFITNYIFQKE